MKSGRHIWIPGKGSGAFALLLPFLFCVAYPVANQAPPVKPSVQLVKWIFENGEWTNPQTLPSSNDVGITIGSTDANGLADITTKVNVPDIMVPSIRDPLNSQIYYILLNDSDQNTIGDGGPTISVLLWQAFQAPANPSWNDIGAIFSAYARLYPGMKSRLDISDQKTVIGFAPAILAHMSTSLTDPAYMPVTRDLSPSKMKMIVSWLANFSVAVVFQVQSWSGVCSMAYKTTG